MPHSHTPPHIGTRLTELGNDSVPGAHPYEAIDPFASSISLRIRNNQRRNTISIDNIGSPRLPPIQDKPFHRLSHTATRSIPNINTSTVRVSLESRRSAPVTTSPFVDDASEVQPRRSQDTSQVPSSTPAAPRRRDALDTTIMALETPINVAVVPEATADLEQNQQVSSGHTREAQSTPWNPISTTSETRSTSPSSTGSHHRLEGQGATRYPTFSETFLPPHLDEKRAQPNVYMASPTSTQETPLKIYIFIFITSILPRQIYLHCLLRLPYMYFSRVDQIFVDAHLSLEEIKEMALQDSVDGHVHGRKSKGMPRSYLRLKKNWENFIDNLMREWKTLNIISGLLLSGILTIFQIEGANADPLTRYAALCSLNCALLSLLYGCFFIIRFSGMRRVYRAAEWAIEAQHDQTMIWNVWVMLAMPAIWLVWSILAYVAAIMAFMWRVRPGVHIPPVPTREDFALRVLVCLIFAIGVVYAMLIINTLRRYGSNMDKAWKSRIESFRSQPTKPSEDGRSMSSNGLRSPQWGVDVVPPTPTAYTPVSFYSEVSIQPPTTTPQIPPSFTRRAERPDHTDASPVTERDADQPMVLISSTIHASPKPMVPLEMPITAAAGASTTPAEQSQETGFGMIHGGIDSSLNARQQASNQSTRPFLSPVPETSDSTFTQLGEDGQDIAQGRPENRRASTGVISNPEEPSDQ